MFKPVVYIASPYSSGDPAINAHFQIEKFNELMDEGYCWPIAPLWSHFQHTARPRPYYQWLAYDRAIVAKCDALLRLNATVRMPDGTYYNQEESTGADAEVELARSLGIPVFFEVVKLRQWVYETQAKEQDKAF